MLIPSNKLIGRDISQLYVKKSSNLLEVVLYQSILIELLKVRRKSLGLEVSLLKKKTYQRNLGNLERSSIL